MKTLKKIASLMLVLVMVFSVAPLRAFAFGESNEGTPLEWEVVENNTKRAADKLNAAAEAKDAESSLKGTVRVSIVLDGPSTLDRGYAAGGVSLDPSAASYRESLKRTQDQMAKTISKEVLGGEPLDVVWNLTLAANIISANVPAEKISQIRDIVGVKQVVVENQYEPMQAEEADEPNMSVSTGMTNTQYAWAAGYTGAGSRVAIVDTGLDYLHQSFNPVAFEMAIMQLRAKGKDVDLLDQQDVARVWSSLNASQMTDGGPEDAYFNAKVPFGFSYVDKGFDIEHVNDKQGEHGSHVASIAAANKFIYKEGEDGSISFVNAIKEVRTQGNAPDAQLLVMKVFGKGGGAYDSDYFAAIEDAIVLGADSVNLSLGSAAKGFAYNSTYQEIIDGLKNVNIIWCNSAGNNGSWADETTFGYLYSDAANIGTGGSPATYSSTLSTASVDNDGFTGTYLEFGDDMIFYTETSGYGNPPITTIAGTYEFVYIDGPGVDDNEHVGKTGDQFRALGRSVVSGKIAVCNRGTSSFFAKANAATAQGAVAVLIANNQPGTIGMNLTDYTGRKPVVSITRADGDLLMAGSEAHDFTGSGESFTYYTGTITVGDAVATNFYGSDFYTMSSFSSFGVPETLDLKPEITTPGGNIYAVNGLAVGDSGITGGHDQYENMSGTSMASPQTAGIVAVLAEYFRESGIDAEAARLGLSQRQMLQSLLMSTATPLVEQEAGSFYSVLKQGAGLANLEGAINARSLVLMDGADVAGEVRKDMSDDAADGKVKAELGDDPERTGNYSVQFRLYNLTDEEITFDLSADFMTQDIFAYYTYDQEGNPMANEDGSPVVSTYLDTFTVPLAADLTWYVDGNEIEEPEPVVEHDANKDGVFDEADADAILNFIAGKAVDDFDQEAADFDGDGNVTSYDAYLALEAAQNPPVIPVFDPQATVPAKGFVTVKVTAQIDELADYDDNGAYVEGYIFAKESETRDGAEGVTHSIPVVGYYGSWGEAPMVDVGSALEYEYGLESRYPYMAQPMGLDALGAQYFIGEHNALGVSYKLGGNPVGTDSEYHPERNAVNDATVLAGANYSQIRNSVGYRYVLEGEEGGSFASKTTLANTYSAYYHQNQGKWMNLTTSTAFGVKPADCNAAEGEKMTLSFYLAPEYYLDNEAGTIAWNEIKECMSYSFTVDSTAPELMSVFGTRLEDGKILVTVSAKDNGYIAGFFVYDEDGTLVYEKGSREDDKNGDVPDRQSYVMELEATAASDHLEIEVWDYAANITTYRLNLNQEELNDPISVIISDETASGIVGNSIKLDATVYPWGYEDQRIEWTSSDETIATVNENGLVYGADEGTVIITATSVADPAASASCEVTFLRIERELKGFVWDEEGEVWIAGLNTAEIPEYEKLCEENIKLPLTGTAYSTGRKLYATTFDSEKLLSSLYVLDEETWEATLVGDSSIGYMDIAPTYRLGRNMLLGVYGPYVVIINATTGDYLGAFDFSEDTGGAELVGIAYEEPYRSSYGWSDYYFLVDVNGNVYNAGFLPYNGSYANFTPQLVGNLGSKADVPYFQSLYWDGTDLYWSNFVEAENKVNMIFVNDLYNDGAIYNLGSYADSVWPVSGLFNDEELHLIGQSTAGSASKDSFVLDQDSVMLTEVSYDFGRAAAEGGLNESLGSTAAAVTRDEIRGFDQQPADDGTGYDVTISVEAREAMNNGLFEVNYDPEAMTLVGVDAEFGHMACEASETGKVTFAFADLEEVAEGGTVFTLRFAFEGENETKVTVVTKESGDDFDATAAEYTVAPLPPEPPVSDVRVVAYPESLAQYFEVTGNTVTVFAENACKLGYLVNGAYVALEAEEADNGYAFEVPEGIEEVVLVVKGDANLDGRLSNADATKAASVLKSGEDPDALLVFAADVNGDERLSNADVTRIKAVLKAGEGFDW